MILKRNTEEKAFRSEDQQSSLRATISAVYVVSVLKHITENSIQIVFLRRIFWKSLRHRREDMSSCRLALRTPIYIRERLVGVKPSVFKMFHGKP